MPCKPLLTRFKVGLALFARECCRKKTDTAGPVKGLAATPSSATVPVIIVGRMCWKIAYKGRKVAAAMTSTAYFDLLRRRPLPLPTRVSTHRAQARTAPARAAAIGRLKAEARRSSLARDCRSNSKRQYGPTRRAMLPVGESYIELLESASPDSGVSQWIREKGAGLFHICFEVDDIDGAL